MNSIIILWCRESGLFIGLFYLNLFLQILKNSMPQLSCSCILEFTAQSHMMATVFFKTFTSYVSTSSSQSRVFLMFLLPAVVGGALTPVTVWLFHHHLFVSLKLRSHISTTIGGLWPWSFHPELEQMFLYDMPSTWMPLSVFSFPGSNPHPVSMCWISGTHFGSWRRSVSCRLLNVVFCFKS